MPEWECKWMQVERDLDTPLLVALAAPFQSVAAAACRLQNGTLHAKACIVPAAVRLMMLQSVAPTCGWLQWLHAFAPAPWCAAAARPAPTRR